jgi:antitoxin Xre/MbcA/ParS-like protein
MKSASGSRSQPSAPGNRSAAERLEQLPLEDRAALGSAGFRTFIQIADEWELGVADRVRLLGDIAESTYHKWRNGGVGTPSRDQLERLSLLLGIYKALRLIFSDESTGTRWLKGANTDAPFAPKSPLELMLQGSIVDLYAVRRYLDAWRGGWP